MDERIKILIVEVSKRKCFNGTLQAKPGVTVIATNPLKMRKSRCLHLECIYELQKPHNIEDSLSLPIIFSYIPHN